MDSVRFGRVLGIGTRLAAKTVAAAVDAATAPNPSGTAVNAAAQRAASGPTGATQASDTRAGDTRESRAGEAGAKLGRTAAATRAQVKQKQAGIQQGKKRFGEAVWGPFTKAGKVLWLEFTGVFFGLFALSAATGAWKLRGVVRGQGGGGDARMHFFLLVGVAVVFGYFCVSGFVRASRRSRR